MGHRRATAVLIALIATVLGTGLVTVVLERGTKFAAPRASLFSRAPTLRGSPSEQRPAVTGPAGSDGRRVDVSAYRGLGAWVDAFDYAPAYHRPEEGPQVAPEDLDAMAAHGVGTLFLQAARPDERSPEGIVDRALVGRFLERAHRVGMKVVAWYLPKFGDVDADLARLRLLRDFRVGGHRFDGIAVDIEYRRDVPDDAERNRRVIELSRRLRQGTPGVALGAIVYPPVLLEAIQPTFWPNFPWAEIADAYDVWLPMAYWTELAPASEYRDGYRYAEEGTRRLRANLGNASALVHVIGGVADAATDTNVAGLVRAARETHAVGWSLYDYRTTSDATWDVLRGIVPRQNS